MNQPLLTVIIPCYNVEKYVDKCVSSIVGQTYTNLEILLIDDGSTDTTGKICDAWQEKDSRVRVIDKQNEGLAYARKTGVENATGEYVTFVDADDWIDTGMYSGMITALLSTNSDIASCDVCLVYEDGRMVHRIEKHDASIKTMGRIEGIAHIFEDTLWNICFWNKVYKKNLFNHFEFIKGLSYSEDLIIYQLYHQASQTVFVNSEYCFYFQRSDSICRTKSIPAELDKVREWSDTLYEVYCFLEKYLEYYNVSDALKRQYVVCASMRLLHVIIAYPQQFTSKYFSFKAKQLRSIPLGKRDWIPRNAKIELYLLKISPGLYKISRQFYNWIIQYTNRLQITNRRTCKFITEPDFYWIYSQNKNTNWVKLILKAIKKIYKIIINNPVYGEILMLHSVVDKRSQITENRLMQVTPDFLEQTILKYQSSGYRLVSLDEVQQQFEKKKRNKRKFVCFTLDDGYADNYEQAYPVFKKYNCPFAIYVTTGYIDKEVQFWWHQLEEVVLKNEKLSINGKEYDCSDLDKKNRAFMEISDSIFSLDAETLSALKQLYKENDCETNVRALSWEQIAELAADPLCTIAAHTVSHASLPSLSDEMIRKELSDGKERIEEKIKKPVIHFSYPHGDWDDRVVKIAMEQFGTAVLATIGGDYVRKGDSVYMLNRMPLEE